MQKISFFSQRVDNRIKLCLELVGFEITSKIIPRTEETISVGVHISSEITDETSLTGNL